MAKPVRVFWSEPRKQAQEIMEIKPGLSALVTGGGSGIGKALCLALAKKGVFVTIVDYVEENGREVASLAANESAKFHPKLDFPCALFVRCDVTNTSDLSAAFEKHVAMYGNLDICINCAGIGNSIPFYEDQTDGARSWRRTISVNLIAVIDCTRLAIKMMRSAKKSGVIINMGSGSGLYPMYIGPIYSSSKGGVVLFSRSLAPYKKLGIRVNVLCPGFVKTALAEKVDAKLINDGFVPMEMVVKGTFELISDEEKAGACLWITNRRGMEYWPSPSEEEKYLVGSSSSRKIISHEAPTSFQIPQNFEKLVVQRLSHDFRLATSVVRKSLRTPIEPHKVLLKIVYAGVNASDVNFSSGRFFGGNKEDIRSRLPFDAGFEVVGLVVAVGSSVSGLEIGSPAAVIAFGGYAEYLTVSGKSVLPIPRPDPEVVAMLTSGLTASISLEKAGQMGSGEVILVTAAAGGTGQFAVQLAKIAGNAVVATCGGQEKAKMLKDLGVDRVIDYKAENIKFVLKKEYPKGVDIVHESVGGEMLNLCMKALAVHGRLVVVGMISQYQGENGWTPSTYRGLCENILSKSRTVAGFSLVQYEHLWQEHLEKLFNLYSSGKIKVAIDPKPFMGLQAVADAEEYLHSGKSVGKVVVCVDPSFRQQISRL